MNNPAKMIPMNPTPPEARQQALLARDNFALQSTSLIGYQSNGRVIVLGSEADVLQCRQFSKPLQLTLVVTTGARTTRTDHQAMYCAAANVEVSGYLGNFTLRLKPADSLQPIELTADIIVDLNAEALLQRAMLPPGYLHEPLASSSPQALEIQLLDWVGAFEKPKYFQYHPEICAHGVNGKTVCTQCIDACPAQAISSLVEKIEVDPYLCQGGGACASVCPSGAIEYVYPTLTDQGNRIREMLRVFEQAGGVAPVLLFHTENTEPQGLLERYPQILPLAVEELASVGVDLCLSALVYGAVQVVLLVDQDVPPIALERLNQQLNWLQTLLTGLRLDPQRVIILQSAEHYAPLQQEWDFPVAPYTMPDNKRSAIFQAIDYLYQQVEKTRELVALPAGAPFGEAIIDENRCTLCMACISACPGKALQDGSNRQMPEVFFIESHCIQCGACTHTCPEQAISISPRIILNREKRNRSRSLNQDTPFACISCGKPFASASVIRLMNHKLKDHYMFSTPRALSRLKMCDTCRVADIAQDAQALNGHLDPLN